MRLRLIVLALIGTLSGCAPETMRVWDLAGQPGLLFKVKTYYERNGREEGGRCADLIMEGVTRTEVLSDTPDRMTIALRYGYRDDARTGQGCDAMRSLRCTVNRKCQGFGERVFTVAKEQDGLRVVEMTGEQRQRANQQ